MEKHEDNDGADAIRTEWAKSKLKRRDYGPVASEIKYLKPLGEGSVLERGSYVQVMNLVN